jgi:hypothetical protein
MKIELDRIHNSVNVYLSSRNMNNLSAEKNFIIEEK